MMLSKSVPQQDKTQISERYTQPPKAFTEDTLLSAMESGGKEDTPEDAERKGLGLSLKHI